LLSGRSFVGWRPVDCAHPRHVRCGPFPTCAVRPSDDRRDCSAGRMAERGSSDGDVGIKPSSDRKEDMSALEATADDLSLYQLFDPRVLANPYPLYRRLLAEKPVYWDPFLHSWVVTGYHDVIHVLHRFSAQTTPTPEQLDAVGLSAVSPIAKIMVRQMLFMDPPDHTRLRGLASVAFTPARVARLREHIQQIVDGLLDKVAGTGKTELIRDFAAPMPAVVTAEMFGMPTSDHVQLKTWSADFAEMLGNFQNNPDRFARVLMSIEDMSAYFHQAVRRQREQPRDGLIQAMIHAELDGGRL